MKPDDHDLDRWLHMARRNFIASIAEGLNLDSLLEQVRSRAMPPTVTRGTVSVVEVDVVETGRRAATPPVANPSGPTAASTPTLDYARRVYDRAIDWYKVAESKAQHILTVNGVFVTIAFGFLSSRPASPREAGAATGVETWLFLVIAAIGLAGAIGAATASLLSRHQYNIAATFAHVGVDPHDPRTYRPEVLWYFGHLATLDFDSAVAALRSADDGFEVDTLTYNVVNLSKVVLRKHRFINAGWTLTAVALIALIAAAASYLVRLQI